MSKRLYIIAGEASGDMHGANLIRQLKIKDPDLDIRAWGGDRMKAEGAEVIKHYRDLAFMGFVEVLFNLRTILRNIKFCKSDILEFKPDAVILIDYPGFNLRIGDFVKKNGIKVFYYISPQVWAWKQKRVFKIREIVDEMFVILPFEKAFYNNFDMDVHFVGHPLLDEIGNSENFKKIKSEKPILALLPGSRKQEIKRMLPMMLKAAKDQENLEIVVAGAPSIPDSFYQKIIGPDIRIASNQTYDLLNSAHIAVVTSGTATLETGLFGVPQVVCYKGNFISYLIARQLVKVNFISLVNLIMDKEIVKELIQSECSSDNISDQISSLSLEESRKRLKFEYAELRKKLGGSGASELTASLVLKNLQET